MFKLFRFKAEKIKHFCKSFVWTCGWKNVLFWKALTKKRGDVPLCYRTSQPISYVAILNLSFGDFIVLQFKAIIGTAPQRWMLKARSSLSYDKISDILAVNRSSAAVYLQLYCSTLIKKEAAVSGALISNTSRTQCLSKCFCTQQAFANKASGNRWLWNMPGLFPFNHFPLICT